MIDPENTFVQRISRRDALRAGGLTLLTLGLGRVGREAARTTEYDPSSPDISIFSLQAAVARPITLVHLADTHFSTDAHVNATTLTSAIEKINTHLNTLHDDRANRYLLLTGDQANHGIRETPENTTVSEMEEFFEIVATVDCPTRIAAYGNHEIRNPNFRFFVKTTNKYCIAPQHADEIVVFDDDCARFVIAPDFTSHSQWYHSRDNILALRDSVNGGISLIHNAMPTDPNLLGDLFENGLFFSGHAHGGHVAGEDPLSRYARQQTLRSIGYYSPLINGIYQVGSNLNIVSPGIGSHPSNPFRSVRAECNIFRLHPFQA